MPSALRDELTRGSRKKDLERRSSAGRCARSAYPVGRRISHLAMIREAVSEPPAIAIGITQRQRRRRHGSGQKPLAGVMPTDRFRRVPRLSTDREMSDAMVFHADRAAARFQLLYKPPFLRTPGADKLDPASVAITENFRMHDASPQSVRGSRWKPCAGRVVRRPREAERARGRSVDGRRAARAAVHRQQDRPQRFRSQLEVPGHRRGDVGARRGRVRSACVRPRRPTGGPFGLIRRTGYRIAIAAALRPPPAPRLRLRDASRADRRGRSTGSSGPGARVARWLRAAEPRCDSPRRAPGQASTMPVARCSG